MNEELKPSDQAQEGQETPASSAAEPETQHPQQPEEAAPEADSADAQEPVNPALQEEEYVIGPIPEGEKLSVPQRRVWEDRANEILDKIRPYIQHDGGDCELLGIDEDGIAYVTFLGACAGCMMAGEDFSTGIRLLLLDEFPELREVVLVG